jgi:site-specific DNA-methyltransferase (adenine-specific)
VRQHKDEFNHHPTLKPTDLMSQLVKLVTWQDDIVLDPFMGSGSTGVACVLDKRRFIGYDTELEYFQIAQKRLEGVE